MHDNSLPNTPPMPIIDSSDLVERIFLIPINKDGQCLQERIVKAIEDYNDDCAKDSSRFKFICSMKDDETKEVFSYNEIIDYLE